MSVPGKIVLHRMGYYDDQDGIMRRYKAEEPSWESHLQKSRELIIKAIDIFNPSTITVLGSGWLLDLPVEKMTMNKRSINLVDILLPEQIENRIQIFRHVRFIQEDVTGGLISGVYANVSRGIFKRRVNVEKILDFKPYEPPKDTDLVISLNLLSQLDAIPTDYLKKRTKVSDQEIRVLKERVQQQHLDMLQKRNSLLITDFYEHPVNSVDISERRPTIAVDLPEGISREEWDWTFDTRKNYNPDTVTIFRVAGIIFRG
ncbi:MAG TPA: hypothetical protein PKH02_06035 [Bacteroidales bacterium]|nr:hypothetical protein [Bacteroidales bacterium]HPT11707.1 hypothetical protein [Bacteroidales bacterium]